MKKSNEKEAVNGINSMATHSDEEPEQAEKEMLQISDK